MFDNVITSPIARMPKPNAMSTCDDESRRRASTATRDNIAQAEMATLLAEYAQKEFENIMIYWKREHPAGSFEEFVLDVFPENASTDDGGYITLDARVEGYKWREVFDRLRHTDELHEMGEPPMPAVCEGSAERKGSHQAAWRQSQHDVIARVAADDPDWRAALAWSGEGGSAPSAQQASVAQGTSSAQPSEGAQSRAWRGRAGRTSGPDDYQFGDLTRSLVRKMNDAASKVTQLVDGPVAK